MRTNLFKKIRRRSLTSAILVTLLSNITVFAQPLGQMLPFTQLEDYNTLFFNVLVNSNISSNSKPIIINEITEDILNNDSIDLETDTITNGINPFLSNLNNLKETTHSSYSAKLLTPTSNLENKIKTDNDSFEHIIGSTNNETFDNPRDNYVSVIVNGNINSKDLYILSYKLYGLSSASQVTKSINDKLAYGGAIIQRSNKWIEVKEYIPSSYLKEGENNILFNTMAKDEYQYRIKDIEVNKVAKSKNNIQLISKNLRYDNGNIHVIGYVNDVTIDEIVIEGEKVKLENGVFETIIKNPPLDKHKIKISYVDYQGINHDQSFEVFDAKEETNSISKSSIFLHSSKTTSILVDTKKNKLDAFSVSITNSHDKFSIQALEFKDVKPLNGEITNVTYGEFYGYKLNGNKITSAPLKISLKYDESKIPEGYSAKDIKTMYFDKSQKRWKILPIDSLDYKNKQIISSITNETDFINGVIKVPESPETGSYTPTMIADMEYADPATGVVSIAPPTPNNMGSATTSFPIKLPAGRNGMQPSLSVNYNSEGGNSWMGLGWDLSTPAISLNTKWGAPLFDTDEESEIYNLNGQELVLLDNGDYKNPHRADDLNDNVPRQNNRRFYLRKEGNYLKIVRQSNSVNTYSWIVTDKMGNKTTYGGTSNSRLADENGRIAHWAISKMEDPYGNFVEYLYESNTSNIGSSTVNGVDFYLSKILYTKHSQHSGKHYEVDFRRNNYTLNDISDLNRKDKMTNGRNGFLWVTNDLLTEIHISLVQGSNKDRIRYYRFEYDDSVFNKNKLQKVSEYDANGQLFYSNTLEYFKDISSENSLLNSSTTSWSGPSDNLGVELEGDIYGPLESSALGSSKSSGFSAGLRVGFGLGENIFSKNKTIGAAFNFNKNVQNGLSSFQDVNGDGLPDKIFDLGSNIKYRLNTGTGFSNEIYNLAHINEMNNVVSTTTGFAFDVIFFANVGYSNNTTRSKTDSYFVDMNGDGLVDYIGNNRVKFNTSSNVQDLSDFDRIFNTNVNASENKIYSGIINQDVIDNLEFPTLLELQEGNSQFDVIQSWQAPYDGNIVINGNAKLLEINDNDGNPNSFKITIERTFGADNQSISVPVTRTLSSSNISDPMNLSTTVSKGQFIFFRSHNNNFGSGGSVEWSPRITYTNLPSELNYVDDSRKNTRIYDSKDDFVLTNGNTFEVDESQNVTIQSNLTNSTYSPFEFSDDVGFYVKKIRYDTTQDNYGEIIGEPEDVIIRVYSHQAGQITGSSQITTNLQKTNNFKDVLEFSVLSNSNIAWEKVKWKPNLIVNEEIVYPEVNYRIYNDNPSEFSHYIKSSDLPCPIIVDNPITMTDDGNSTYMEVSHNLNELDFSFLEDYHENLSFPLKIYLVVKSKINGEMKREGIRTINVIRSNSGSYVVPNTTNIRLTKNVLDMIKGSSLNGLYVALYTDVKEVAYQLTNANITLSLANNQFDSCNPAWQPIVMNQPFFTTNSNYFGSYHRGWNQFLYNGSVTLERNEDNEIVFNGNNPQIEEDLSGPIDMSVFMDEDEAMATSGIDENSTPDDFEGLNSTIRYTQFNQDLENDRYLNEGIGSTFGLLNGELSRSLNRFGEDNIYELFVSPQDLMNGEVFVGLKQYSKSKGDGLSAGAFGASATDSNAKTRILNQYVDLNGDRYPDVVTRDNIQYTNSLGALEITLDNGFVVENKSDDIYGGVSYGINANSTSSSNGNVTGNKTNTQISAGLGGNDGRSYDRTLWIDINGDGITDKVYCNEDDGVISADLNSGYDFSDTITWGSGYNLLSSRNNSISANATFPLDESGSFAIGAGGGISEAKRKSSFLDVNGDGLPEIVIEESPGHFKYYLNNGTGFESTSRTFYNGSDIGNDKSTSVNIYGTGTYGFFFTIIAISFKTVFTGSLGASSNFSQKDTDVRDINGDGYPDVLRKGNNDTQILANLSKIDKTHLLKKVNTPLGGSWELDYTRDGNTYNMPQSKWLLTKIETNDGFTGDSDFGPDETLTTAVYNNPKYDRREREFYGYEQLTVEQRYPSNNQIYRYSERWIHNNNYYLKGAEKQSGMYTATGEPLSEKQTYYNLLNPDTPQVNEPASNNINGYYSQGNLDEDRDRIFVVPVRTVNLTFEEGISISNTQKFKEYDNFGNITKMIDEGTDFQDAYRTEILYHSGISGVDYGVGFPVSIKVYQNNISTLLRQRDAIYNSNGKLQRITTKLNTNENNRTEFNYDDFGNTIKVTQLDNTAGAGTPFESVIEYDTTVRTYPIRISDSFGQESTANYEYHFGTPVYTVDMNNQPMRTRIDSRGRIIEVTGPNELLLENSSEQHWTIRTQYKGNPEVSSSIMILNQDEYVSYANGSFTPETSNGQHYTLTRHFDPTIQSNQFLTVSIVDGFGQAIQVKKTHVMNETDDLKWLISGKEIKDAFGRTEFTYLTTIEDNYPTNINTIDAISYLYNDDLSNIQATATFYDEKNRPLQTSLVDNHQVNFNYSIDGNFVKSTSTQTVEGNNQTMSSFTDSRGRKRKTIQNNELTTQFEYNAINELVKVINNENQETNSIYDMAGRRIEVQHPDQGATKMTYDKASNLIKRQTSNLFLNGQQEISYEYEYNRLKKIIYPQTPQNNVFYEYGNPTDPNAQNYNTIGRLYKQTDATGVQIFGYGNMGELNRNLRSVAVAGKKAFYFLTTWEYDSWNRVLEINYPDEEKVKYIYNKAGNLKNIKSAIPNINNVQDVVSNISYTQYGERKQIKYGNGTETNYSYDDRRRMNIVNHQFNGFQVGKQYTYDGVSNILGIETLTPSNSVPDNGEIGGPVNHTYTYDSYNRLVTANGNFTGANDLTTPLLRQEYTLEMSYDLAHRITSKTQTHVQGEVTSITAPLQSSQKVGKTDYMLSYEDYATGALVTGSSYGYQQPHAPRKIIERPSDYSPGGTNNPSEEKIKILEYDANGNQTKIKERVGETEITLRHNLWDEENRLKAVDINPDNDNNHPIAVYAYDAGGERVVKYNWEALDVKSNATNVGYEFKEDFFIYPSGILVGKVLSRANDKRPLDYTKHYYAGAERMSSKLGTMRKLGDYPTKLVEEAFPNLIANEVHIPTNTAQQNAKTYVLNAHTAFELSIALANVTGYDVLTDYTHDSKLYDGYYYHSDHLGSSNYITNLEGVVSQHMEYMPFGELLVDEHLNSNNALYKFNAKELDGETGNYYYSARYYDPKFSIWLSVDPLAEKYPEWSPYNYVMQNPVRLIDPTGMGPEDIYKLLKNGKIEFVKKSEGPDVLFATDEFGNIDEDNSIEIKDKTILPNLSKSRDDYKGHYALTNNKKDAFNTFYFAAKNSDSEYSITGFSTQGNKDYVITTSLDSDFTNTHMQHDDMFGFELKNQLFEIHSHPNDGNIGASGYAKSYITADRYYYMQKIKPLLGIREPAPHYMFNIDQKALYNYDFKKGDNFIRTINKPSDLYRKLGF